MNRALYVVLGAALGLLVGWFAFGHGFGPTESPQARLAAPVPSATRTVRAPIPDAPIAMAKPNAQAIAGSPASGAGGVISPLQMQQLQARVAELEQKLALQNKVATEKDGAPIPMPEHLDPRFSPDKIRLSINEALKRAGLDGEATSVDCSEYPCLAIGEMKSTSFDREQTTQVADQLRKMGYPKDSTTGFGASIEDNGQRRNLFGLAIYPKTDSDDQQQLIGKRLHYRFTTSQGIE